MHRTVPGKVYNVKRLHSALGCLPPAEFGQSFMRSLAPRGHRKGFRQFGRLRYEFFEASGNPSPDESRGENAGAALAALPRPDRYDEFPAGYSSAGCAPPQSPPPLYQLGHRVTTSSAGTIEKQRTADSVLTPCLTQRRQTHFALLPSESKRDRNQLRRNPTALWGIMVASLHVEFNP